MVPKSLVIKSYRYRLQSTIKIYIYLRNAEVSLIICVRQLLCGKLSTTNFIYYLSIEVFNLNFFCTLRYFFLFFLQLSAVLILYHVPNDYCFSYITFSVFRPFFKDFRMLGTLPSFPIFIICLNFSIELTLINMGSRILSLFVFPYVFLTSYLFLPRYPFSQKLIYYCIKQSFRY